MNSPALPRPIGQALSRYPAPVQARLLEIRELIFAVAAETEGVGQLTETLKWGEPAYLTDASKCGTTIRLGIAKRVPEDCAVLFNCKTTLLGTFRTLFADDFTFEGNRALVVPSTQAIPREAMMHCLHMALTYHRRKAGRIALL